MNSEQQQGSGSRAPAPGTASSDPAIGLVGPDSRPRQQGGCLGTSKAGQPCRATVTADGWCCHHSPRYTAEERLVWAKRGGLSSVRKNVTKKLEALGGTLPDEHGDLAPSYETAAGVRAYLERQSQRVANGRLAPSQAGAIAQFAALAVKLAEIQLERDMLDAEIAAATDNGRPTRPKVEVAR